MNSKQPTAESSPVRWKLTSDLEKTVDLSQMKRKLELLTLTYEWNMRTQIGEQ